MLLPPVITKGGGVAQCYFIITYYKYFIIIYYKGKEKVLSKLKYLI